MKPHEYQLRVRDHIISHDKAAIFLDMGLGKSLSTLLALEHLMYYDLEVDSVLIIAPKRVVTAVWRQEIKKWDMPFSVSMIIGNPQQRLKALHTKADIYIVGRDSVVWLEENCTRNFNMLVVDESTSFKNPSSKRFKALRKMAFKRVVLLTGTPSPKSLMDLWSQFFLLDRGDRLEKTITKFRRLYFDAKYQEGYTLYRPLAGADKIIHKKVSDITISMKARDYIELPPRIDNDINVVLTPQLRKKYEEFKRELVISVEGVDVTALTAATLSNKLLQFCSGQIYDENHNVNDIHSLKMEALDEQVDKGENILLAWLYKHERDRILTRYSFARELKTTEDIEAWNRGEVKLLIVHPSSAAHGLNLQVGGNTIIWFTSTWDAELDSQFNARLLRPGQKRPVIIHRLTTDAAIEARLRDSLHGKYSLQEALLEALK